MGCQVMEYLLVSLVAFAFADGDGGEMALLLLALMASYYVERTVDTVDAAAVAAAAVVVDDPIDHDCGVVAVSV